jgi:GntR family transcriptional repressor for pyruvate dehydrogenase complex
LSEVIQRRKVYELLAERLTAEIGSGLQPGHAVPSERSLMQQYGVGRSSVREALRMLESRRLIENRGAGRFVIAEAPIPFEALVATSETDMAQLFEVRALLEGEAAALAAARRTDAHLAALNAAIDEMAGGVDTEERFIAADLKFHLTIAGATGNPVIVHLMEAIRDRLRAAFGTVFHIPGSAERSVAQHREIAAAVALLRPDEARAAMHEHIARVEREFASGSAR